MVRHGLMRAIACGMALAGLVGCGALDNGKRPTLEGELDVIDATGLNDIMLTMANPEEGRMKWSLRRRLLAKRRHWRALA